MNVEILSFDIWHLENCIWIDRKDSDLLTGTEEHYQYFRKIVIELFRKIEILTISQTFLDFLNFQET